MYIMQIMGVDFASLSILIKFSLFSYDVLVFAKYV